MIKFESRFNFNYFLIAPLALAVPILITSIGVLGLLENIQSGEIYKDWGFTLVTPLLCISLVVATVYHFYTLSPRIVITKREIVIGKNRISMDQIKQITVRGKSRSKYLFLPYIYESCSVLLNNGEELSVAVENYANGNLIRVNLDNIKAYLLGKTQTIEIVEISRKEIIDDSTILTGLSHRYMRSPFKSFNNNALIFVIGILLWVIAKMEDASFVAIAFFTALLLLFYLLLVLRNHYFVLTDKHLIIKNLFFPLKKRVFSIDNIDYLDTEDIPKFELALKIITKDFNIYRFPSGLMSFKMFTDLKRNVKDLQQPVKPKF